MEGKEGTDTEMSIPDPSFGNPSGDKILNPGVELEARTIAAAEIVAPKVGTEGTIPDVGRSRGKRTEAIPGPVWLLESPGTMGTMTLAGITGNRMETTSVTDVTETALETQTGQGISRGTVLEGLVHNPAT